jgi:hypothetical protein
MLRIEADLFIYLHFTCPANPTDKCDPEPPAAPRGYIEYVGTAAKKAFECAKLALKAFVPIINPNVATVIWAAKLLFDNLDGAYLQVTRANLQHMTSLAR